MSIIEKAFAALGDGVEAGEEALHEWNVNRHAAQLFLKLGIAAYAEARLGGTHEPIERVLKAIDGHVAENGAIDLDEQKAAESVLGEEFVEANSEAAHEAAAAAEAAAVEEPVAG